MHEEALWLLQGTLSMVIHHASPDRHLICCHGLHSSKESRKYHQLAALAQEAGITVTRFDFRGCGESRGNMQDATLSQRIQDLQGVLTYIQNRFPEPRIALFGSSFGGMTAIMVAAGREDIKALAVMATPHALTQDLGLEPAFMDDLHEYNVLAAVARTPPLLILHGTRDELVPVEQAHQLYAQAPVAKKMLLFPTDPSFTHQGERDAALTAALNWCADHLH